MIFSDIVVEAVTIAIRYKIPFVLCMRPWSDEVIFFCDIDGVQSSHPGRTFIVNSWGGGNGMAYSLNEIADADAVIKYAQTHTPSDIQAVSPWGETTEYDVYVDAVDELIDKLNEHGGKTVISRTICSHGHTVDWISVADSYFWIHPEAFRYMYYTPRHGFWLGASPELLLQAGNDRFMTMALAGTRPLSEENDPWSGKNIAEQAIVRNYITERLYDIGLTPEVCETETVTTGNIQHLRTIITGNTGMSEPSEIIETLNPTPALAGYPLAMALENIVETERHPRRCYGSYVALCEGEEQMEAYVNLRCVNFNEDSWCMYVGGGIMPDSDSNDEWEETEAKSLILRKLIEDSQK